MRYTVTQGFHVGLAHDELASSRDLDYYGVACDAVLRTGGLCPCVRLN